MHIIYAARTCILYTLHVHVYYKRCTHMYIIYAARTCILYMLHVHVYYIRCMYMYSINAVHTCRLYTLEDVHVYYRHCTYMYIINAVHTCLLQEMMSGRVQCFVARLHSSYERELRLRNLPAVTPDRSGTPTHGCLHASHHLKPLKHGYFYHRQY